MEVDYIKSHDSIGSPNAFSGDGALGTASNSGIELSSLVDNTNTGTYTPAGEEHSPQEFYSLADNSDAHLDNDSENTKEVETIPDLTQEKMHKIPQLVSLTKAYCTSYSDCNATVDDHMERAQNMANALLSHYFPENQGFRVVTCSFDMLAKYGWSIEESFPKGVTSTGYNIPFQYIPSENIAGFRIEKLYSMWDKDGSETTKWFPHTFLAIMVDDLSTYDKWVPVGTTSLKCGDIMSYSFGIEAKIKKGQGILILGDHVEFYSFNSGSEKGAALYGGKHGYRHRLVEDELPTVDQYFRKVATADVAYQNGVLGTGAREIAGEL